MSNAIFPIVLGMLGLLSALLIFFKVRSAPAGSGKVKEIGDEIHLGAMVFMSREYKLLGIFSLICVIALYFSLGWETSIAFVLGASCSGAAPGSGPHRRGPLPARYAFPPV